MKSSTPPPSPLPPVVLEAVAGATGQSPPQIELAWMSWAGTAWRAAGPGGVVFVKRAADLAAEHDRLQWLARRWPVAEVVAMLRAQGDHWLVTRGLDGVQLCHPSVGWEGAHVARFFGETLRALHETDAKGCPFGVSKRGNVLVHGDYCLPNVLVRDGRLSGVVDVGGAGLGNPEDDLAAGIWTLQYNFGRGHAGGFLAAYGWPPMSEAATEKLRRRYSTRLR